MTATHRATWTVAVFPEPGDVIAEGAFSRQLAAAGVAADDAAVTFDVQARMVTDAGPLEVTLDVEAGSDQSAAQAAAWAATAFGGTVLDGPTVTRTVSPRPV